MIHEFLLLKPNVKFVLVLLMFTISTTADLIWTEEKRGHISR